MADICHTSLVGGCGTVAALNFNSICPATWSVIFFVLVFIDHRARSVSQCWAPCVLLASAVSNPGDGVAKSPPVGVSARGRCTVPWLVCKKNQEESQRFLGMGCRAYKSNNQQRNGFARNWSGQAAAS
jgi:hypothetical protein